MAQETNSAGLWTGRISSRLKRFISSAFDEMGLGPRYTRNWLETSDATRKAGHRHERSSGRPRTRVKRDRSERHQLVERTQRSVTTVSGGSR